MAEKQLKIGAEALVTVFNWGEPSGTKRDRKINNLEIMFFNNILYICRINNA